MKASEARELAGDYCRKMFFMKVEGVISDIGSAALNGKYECTVPFDPTVCSDSDIKGLALYFEELGYVVSVTQNTELHINWAKIKY